jgi:hypothetical protein
VRRWSFPWEARVTPAHPRWVSRPAARVIDLESRFASIHAEYLARSVEPGVQGLFSALAMQDRHHMELLEQALRA